MKINRTATTRRLGRTATAVLVGLSLTATACGGSNDSADDADAELAELIDLVVESASERLAESDTSTDINAVAVAPAPNTADTPASSVSSSSSGTSSTDGGTAIAPAAAPSTSTSGTPASASSDSDDLADMPMDDTTGDTTESAPIEPAGDADEPMADEPMDDGYGEGSEADEPMADEPMDDGYGEGYEADEPMADEPMDDGYDDGNTIVSELVVDIDYSGAFGKINVDAELTGFTSDNYKGIESVCLVQYNQYGNPLYTGDARAYTANASYVDIDGVRYPDLIVNGCRPNTDNFGEYTTDWSVESARGTNGSRKDYYDIAVRGVDGQVSVFCMNAENWRNGFVERDMSDYAGSTKLGRCPA